MARINKLSTYKQNKLKEILKIGSAVTPEQFLQSPFSSEISDLLFDDTWFLWPDNEIVERLGEYQRLVLDAVTKRRKSLGLSTTPSWPLSWVYKTEDFFSHKKLQKNILKIARELRKQDKMAKEPAKRYFGEERSRKLNIDQLAPSELIKLLRLEREGRLKCP